MLKCRKFYKILGIVLVLIALAFGLTFPFGSPQLSKHHYLFQLYLKRNLVQSISLSRPMDYTGTWRTWRLGSGFIATECEYLRGKKQGRLRMWYDNGNLRREEHYDQGRQNGWQYSYDIEGSQIQVYYYVNGRLMKHGPTIDSAEKPFWLRVH